MFIEFIKNDDSIIAINSKQITAIKESESGSGTRIIIWDGSEDGGFFEVIECYDDVLQRLNNEKE